MHQRRWPLLTVLGFGYAFLYVPVLLLIVYSFNESRLVTVWSGFSTKWYGALLENTQLLDAAWLSVRIAATNASFAVVLGALAANALVRRGRFRGRTWFELLLTAPLVMPEVIIGLSMLLLFVAAPPFEQGIDQQSGRSQRGFQLVRHRRHKIVFHLRQPLLREERPDQQHKNEDQQHTCAESMRGVHYGCDG